VERLLQFLEENVEFQRLRLNVGIPDLSWSPQGLASPHRHVRAATCCLPQTASMQSFLG